jgi:hypothetical protein
MYFQSQEVHSKFKAVKIELLLSDWQIKWVAENTGQFLENEQIIHVLFTVSFLYFMVKEF